MCTALNVARKISRETNGLPLGLGVATNASPLAVAINENDPLSITPIGQIE